MTPMTQRHKARSPGGASTSSGSAAPGSRPTPTSRARGAPRCGAGTSRRRSSWRRSRASTSTSAAIPRAPPGSRSSSRAAHAGRAEGRSRAEFLAELVALRRSIVVGGAHGKTTTAAMIAYALRELGDDPAWIIGGVVPQLGGNAGNGEGWLVVEGDESDRSIALLRPEIAVVTNVELDHHAAFGSTAELARVLRRLDGDRAEGRSRLGARAGGVRARARRRAQPDERCRRAGRARAGGRRRGRTPRRRSRASRASGGASSSSASAAACASTTTTATTRPRSPQRSATAREQTERRLIAVYQPHVHERTRHLSHELGEALGLADSAVVTEVIGGRDEPRPGVTGKLVLDSVPHGVRRGWAPTLDDAAATHACVGAARRRRRHPRRGGAVEDRARGRRGPARVNIETRRPALAADDDRHGRAGEGAGSPALARRARGGAPLRRGRGARGRRRRSRLERARGGRGRGRARHPARGRAGRGRGARRRASSQAAERPTPSACTARAMRGSAASSSPARSPARPEEASR